MELMSWAINFSVPTNATMRPHHRRFESRKVINYFHSSPKSPAFSLGTHYSDSSNCDAKLYLLCRHTGVILRSRSRPHQVLSEFATADVECRPGIRNALPLVELRPCRNPRTLARHGQHGLPRVKKANDVSPSAAASPSSYVSQPTAGKTQLHIQKLIVRGVGGHWRNDAWSLCRGDWVGRLFVRRVHTSRRFKNLGRCMALGR